MATGLQHKFERFVRIKSIIKKECRTPVFFYRGMPIVDWITFTITLMSSDISSDENAVADIATKCITHRRLFAELQQLNKVLSLKEDSASKLMAMYFIYFKNRETARNRGFLLTKIANEMKQLSENKKTLMEPHEKH
jgi:hypothetical protein